MFDAGAIVGVRVGVVGVGSPPSDGSVERVEGGDSWRMRRVLLRRRRLLGGALGAAVMGEDGVAMEDEEEDEVWVRSLVVVVVVVDFNAGSRAVKMIEERCCRVAGSVCCLLDTLVRGFKEHPELRLGLLLSVVDVLAVFLPRVLLATL